MNIQLILIIIALVIIFFLALKIFKKIVKAAITVFILLLLLTGVAGIIIYNDAMKIKRGFEGEQTIIITNEGEMITAFKTADLTITSIRNQEFYEEITEEELQEIAQKLTNEEYEDIEEENFLIIIEQKTFYEKESTILGVETTAEKEALEKFALSTNIEEAVIALSELNEIEQEELALLDKELRELKNTVYYELLLNQIKETKGTFLIRGIKDREIKTIPRLTSVTVFNIFPESILERMTGEE